ncbi:MAG: hypothetical protein CO098_04680 [Bacteroidetes bacterium CG_4_9_14_3_um_filter_41_19]|nr:MAG: hypothetical protein CO098_04680 [Bacteroidetes bacterium CG_4_9_14_3_um_filter_41_19]
MLNFFISIVVFGVSTFLLAVSVRYGMAGAERIDHWLLLKYSRRFDGFNWYYRIPFAIGIIPEYFYAMVLGNANYFKTNWWALKTASFISVLLFVALLKSRGMVLSYYSLSFMGERGVLAFFTSGTFVWYLNFITLIYVGLAVLIVIESVKMGGMAGLLRAGYMGLMCLLMSNLTLAVLSVIVFVAVIYLIYKVIKFLFFPSNKRNQDDDDESAGEILQKGLSGFKSELYTWESERKSQPKRTEKKTIVRKPVITRKKSTVKRTTQKIDHENDIPRLYPDEK